MFKKINLILLLALFLVCFGRIGYALDNDAYTISDIPITIQAENPKIARDKAIEQAQLTAFEILIKKIFPFEKPETFDAIDNSTILSFVRDFSVKNERHSATEYRAEFTVRMHEYKITNFFENKGVEVTEVEETRVLVIPVLQMGQRLLIWEDPNPWRDAWKASDIRSDGILSVVVPVGDIMDIRSVPDSDVFAKGKDMLNNFQVILQRYNADEIFFSLLKSKGASLSPADGVDVVMYRYNQENQSFEGFGTLPVEGTEDFSKAIETAVMFLNSGWESQLLEQMSEVTNTITVRFPIRTLRDWIITKDKLNEMKILSKVDVLQLNKKFVDLAFEYTGTYDALNMNLGQWGMTLSYKSADVISGNSPSYVLQTRY